MGASYGAKMMKYTASSDEEWKHDPRIKGASHASRLYIYIYIYFYNILGFYASSMPMKKQIVKIKERIVEQRERLTENVIHSQMVRSDVNKLAYEHKSWVDQVLRETMMDISELRIQYKKFESIDIEEHKFLRGQVLSVDKLKADIQSEAFDARNRIQEIEDDMGHQIDFP